LTSTTIPNSVTTIELLAFQNCTSLTSVTIGNSVATIGIAVFAGCTTLPSVIIPNSVTSIGGTAFEGCTLLASVTLQTNVLFTTIGPQTFNQCTSLSSITIPSSVTSIGENAFNSCTQLTSASIGNFVTSIGVLAFSNCTALTSIIIPNSVITIGNSAFQGCTLLASVIIPNSVTTIGNSAFFGCTQLTSVTIGSSVATIEVATFKNCTELTSVTIPSSVTSIRDVAFNGSSKLNLVYFLQPLTLPSLGSDVFTGISESSVGKYYSSVTNSSVIAPFFDSISEISNTIPTLTSITPFTSTSTLAVVTISYANLVTNGNAVVDNNPYVFLVQSLTSGSLSIGTTQGTATPWNAFANKTIASGNNAYWTPPPGGVNGLLNAFSVVVQDAVGEVSSPNVDVQVNGPYPCFLEGTKILCFENNEEVYRPVESLQKGDLVKTIYNGYMPICMMGTKSIYNPGNDDRFANRLYKCSIEKYPTLFEDLYITGCHSILVPWMTNDQWENTKAVNGNIYVTDNHFRLIACADEKAEPYNKEGFMNIYHIALDHHDICMNYGIYANGLLVESCSIEYLIMYSNLKILGEADSATSEGVDKVSNNITCKLVETC
jgi:hypothetical protein